VALASTRGAGIWQSADGGRSFNAIDGYQTLSRQLNGVARGPDKMPTGAGMEPRV
jgi:hypothetical protein